jgi:choline dehydrogenase-like flavoprotein/predicted dehydrogenase
MSSASTPLHVAFLGCGFITRVHSRHIARLGGDIMTSYASRDAGKADAFRRALGGRSSYGSYAAALADPRVDAVVVAVPPTFHLDLTLQALAAGKHVLVEKPAFPTLADYDAVVRARDRAGRIVIVGENDHYKPLAVHLRRVIAGGAIGEMVFAHFTTIAKRLKSGDDWRNDETLAGGDAFFEEGIHWLHLAGSLGPSITSIEGFRPEVSRTGPDTRAKSMMVAFRYDNRAVGSLYYSREVPSLLKGLRLSKIFGREGVITFESNGLFVAVRGRGLPRLALPGFRDIRGYQAMYRDFARAIRGGGPPEMNLERAIEDQRLMDLRRPDAGTFANVNTDFDVIIVGSGAGGGTMAQALSTTSARVLVIERGDVVPQEPENWNPRAVWKDLRYRTRERWRDGDGREFLPYTHYCVGGNTKFWGSVLYRLRREDFGATEHVDGVSPAWPIDYDTLAPYYDRAERLYHVHGQQGADPTDPPRGPFPHPPIPHAPGMAALVDAIARQGLHPAPLPLGLIRPGERDGCILCNTCNSFPCRLHAKSDADVCAIRPATARPNVTLWTNAYVRRLLTDPSGRRIEAVEVERHGETMIVGAPLVVVSCGAVNSAALLLRSTNARHPHGLANSSGLVGRRYMAHLATMMQGFHPFRKNEDVFQKTVAINDFYLRGPETPYPLGQIQSQGRTHGVMAQTVVPWIPLWPYDLWVARGVDWLVMSEDLPNPDNRVTLDADGHIRLACQPDNRTAHRQLVVETERMLKRLGFWTVIKHSHGNQNTTHQCGTLCFGTDPTRSVLDPYCRTHDIENLFVVDASLFPSSAAVNPGLTIAAQALRVADHIIEQYAGASRATRAPGAGITAGQT